MAIKEFSASTNWAAINLEKICSHGHRHPISPIDFWIELDQFENIHFSEPDRSAICNFARGLYNAMTRRFGLALQKGFVKLTAKVGSRSSGLSVIDFNVLDGLRLAETYREGLFEEDLKLDDAVTADRVRLYSFGIEPSGISIIKSDIEEDGTTKTRGRKKKFDDQRIVDEIVKLLLLKGLPSSNKPAWTWEAIAKSVGQAWGEDPPSRPSILSRKNLAIAKYKERLKQRDF